MHQSVSLGDMAPVALGDVRSVSDALRRVPVLSALDDARVSQLAERGRIERRGVGPVFREGDAADRLYVILEGAVRIFRRNAAGDDVTLTTLGAGAFFGEIALLDGGSRSASAAALEPSQMFTLDRAAFFGLLAASPDVIAHVFTDLTTKVRDSTERYFREELAARETQAQMERERHKALAQMVAGVAHELNTPLGIAITAASLIIRASEADALVAVARAAPDAQECLTDIAEAVGLLQKNVHRAHGLVQAFKNLSVSQVVDEIEGLELPGLVAEVLELFRLNARQAKLEIEVLDRLPSNGRMWTGYRGLFSQVLLNLLTNVQRYAYPDGVGGRVEIQLELDDDREVPAFVVTVRDFGAGIPPENLPRVFDAFFTTGRGRGGSGLGMAIVHNLVTEGMRGRVSIESEVGAGTAARVDLPRVVEAVG